MGALVAAYSHADQYAYLRCDRFSHRGGEPHRNRHLHDGACDFNVDTDERATFLDAHTLSVRDVDTDTNADANANRRACNGYRDAHSDSNADADGDAHADTGSALADTDADAD
jgi:hypothetical protein